jgi:hypothetical protein
MLTQQQLSHRFTLEEYLNCSQVDFEKTIESNIQTNILIFNF